MELTTEEDAEIQRQVLSKSKAVHDEMVEKEEAEGIDQGETVRMNRRQLTRFATEVAALTTAAYSKEMYVKLQEFKDEIKDYVLTEFSVEFKAIEDVEQFKHRLATVFKILDEHDALLQAYREQQ